MDERQKEKMEAERPGLPDAEDRVLANPSPGSGGRCGVLVKASISFVIPCLNERETLPDVLSRIDRVRRTVLSDRETEVIVSDNGSSDGSVKTAEDCGARVVHCAPPGYGEALLCGIQHAHGDLVLFADADGTYDFLESPSFVEQLDKGFDLVVGSRLDGHIVPGAMPFLHRYIGTPVLTSIINFLYAGKDGRIADCNSGFRGFRREAFLSWCVRSRGMEFASEMLVKALKSHAKISHVPISLYPCQGKRKPHLRRWQDGMRHLLQVFLDCPRFFLLTGAGLFLLSWLVIFLGLFVGPVWIGPVSFLGLHSMMFGLVGSLFGITICSTGLFLAERIGADIRLYRYVTSLSEGRLFWWGVAIMAASFVMLLIPVIYWASQGFHFIHIEKATLLAVALASNGILLVSNAITAHMLKRL